MEYEFKTDMRLKDKFENLALLIRCYAYALRRGHAARAVKTYENIVIFQRAQLGDMVCTTPMFRAVKKAYPNAHLTVVGKGINKQIVAGNPDVDEYIVWNDNLPEVVTQLKKRKYDFGCSTSPNFHSLAALFLADVKSIAVPKITNGWSPYETRAYKALRVLALKKEHRMRSYAPGQYLRLLEPLNIQTTDTKKYVYYTQAGEEVAKKILDSRKEKGSITVGLAVGAGNKIKQWAPEKFAQISDYLVEKYNADIVLIGTKENAKETEAFLTAVTHKERILDTTDKLSIDALKALTNKLNLFVSVDTGPVFFAESQGVPTVDIAGNIDENEQAPNDGKDHLVVIPPNRGEPVVMTMNAHMIDFKEAQRQIDSVTVDLVKETVDKIMPRVREIQASRKNQI